MTTEHSIKHAVLYCRVSSAKQVKKGDGLGSQETRCREYAKYKGYEVVHVFRDEGVSGGMIERPAMQEMLAFLKKSAKQRPHVVIIDDISRLARGLEAHIQLRTAISAVESRLESPSIEFGDDPDSRLVENLLASVSQHARQKNAEQVVNRMRARVMNGYWCFYPCIGYKYDRVKGHGKLLVRDEPLASVVAEAFEGFASGRFGSNAEVKRFLDAQPAFPKDKNGEVHFSRVEEMFRRSIYAGYIDVAKWNVSLHPGKHEALVSFETWQKVQTRLDSKPVAPIRKDISSDFPLRGFVTCGCCDHPMTSAWAKGRHTHYAYYFCQSKGCDEYRKSIRREVIEADFEALLRDMCPAPGLFHLTYDMLRDLWQSRLEGAEEQKKAARAEIVQIERKSANLMERLVNADGHALVTAYENQIRKLEETRIALIEKTKNFGRPVTDFDQTYRTVTRKNTWDLGDNRDYPVLCGIWRNSAI